MVNFLSEELTAVEKSLDEAIAKVESDKLRDALIHIRPGRSMFAEIARVTRSNYFPEIKAIKDPTGGIVTSKLEIRNSFGSFYGDLYSAKTPPHIQGLEYKAKFTQR